MEPAAVLTFATRQAGDIRAFLRSALAHGIRPKVLGRGAEVSPERRAAALAAEIAGYDERRIVLFVEAASGLFLDALPAIVARFDALKTPVLFCARKRCRPRDDLGLEFRPAPTPWRYLDAGAFIGYAGPLRDLLGEMLALSHATDGATDSELASLVHIYGSSEIALDYGCEIFQSVDRSHGDLAWTGGRWRNRVTGTRPSILRLDGDARHDARRFVRRLGGAERSLDASSLDPLEAEALAPNGGGSLAARVGAFLAPARGLLTRLGERVRPAALKEELRETAEGHGILLSRLRGSSLRDQYYRNVFHSRILDSPPIPCEPGAGDFDVRVLTCEVHHVKALWAVKSFLGYAGVSAHVVIHDDGSLSERARATVARHLPGCTIIPRREADPEVAGRLRDFPECARVRARSRWVNLKLFDTALLGPRRPFLLLDSDVLFFAPPAELLGHIAARRPCFMSDYQDAYAFPVADLDRWLGRPFVRRFNSGLVYTEPDLFDLDLLERFFAFARAAGDIPWGARAFLEQTGWALLFSATGREVARLGPSYQLMYEPIGPATTSHHFVSDGLQRMFFYDRGLRRLKHAGFLEHLARGGRANGEKL